jgi:hypothetical protein
MTPNTYYEGIDFANHKANHGECVLQDDGTSLRAFFRQHRPTDIRFARTAVDCPFGTSKGFEAGLRGEILQDDGKDGFKTRVTERWLRDRVSEFRTNQDWRTRDREARATFPRASYFNGGSHIQPSVGLVIVPELLHWLANRLAPGGRVADRLISMKAARRGDGPIIEAHPRLFLYSAFEKVRTAAGHSLPWQLMNAAAGYKAKGAEGERHRTTVFRFLGEHRQWMGTEPFRTLAVEGGEEELIELDHAFDAWLSALTARAHHLCQTLTWQAVEGLDDETVDVEGHILILR